MGGDGQDPPVDAWSLFLSPFSPQCSHLGMSFPTPTSAKGAMLAINASDRDVILPKKGQRCSGLHHKIYTMLLHQPP